MTKNPVSKTRSGGDSNMKLVNLPKTTDLADDILEKAKGILKEVVIIGLDHEGQFYVGSSGGCPYKQAGMIQYALFLNNALEDEDD